MNADVIARGLSGFDPESAAIQAGRVMLQRLRELAEQRVDFAFETALASRAFAPWISELIKDGYTFRVFYVWLADAEMCIKRVAERVQAGGHHVPAEVIRRRYAGGLRNFFDLYRPLAHNWRVYDNSTVGRGGAELVATGHREEVDHVYNERTWTMILRGLERVRPEEA